MLDSFMLVKQPSLWMGALLVFCGVMFVAPKITQAKGSSPEVPQFICVKAAKNTRKHNGAGSRDDSINVRTIKGINKDNGIWYKIHLNYKLGLSDRAHCWDLVDLIEDNPALPPPLGHLINYVIDIQYGSDCTIAVTDATKISLGYVKYFLVDRRVGNLIDPWSCRSFKKGTLETDDTLPLEVKFQSEWEKNVFRYGGDEYEVDAIDEAGRITLRYPDSQERIDHRLIPDGQNVVKWLTSDEKGNPSIQEGRLGWYSPDGVYAFLLSPKGQAIDPKLLPKQEGAFLVASQEPAEPYCFFHDAQWDGVDCKILTLIPGVDYWHYAAGKGYYYNPVDSYSNPLVPVEPGDDGPVVEPSLSRRGDLQNNPCPYHDAVFDGANCRIYLDEENVNYSSLLDRDGNRARYYEPWTSPYDAKGME